MSNSGERCWGVVPAAGIGSRMSAELPKQYLLLHGRTVIEHALQALLDCDVLEAVMVAISPEDKRPPSLACFNHDKVRLTEGGATRTDSVLAALRALHEFAEPSDWVVVHDAARPCVSIDDIHRLIATVKDTGVGGILAEAIADTVKLVSKEGNVVKTMDRELLWRAQTPQVFRLGLLTSALEKAADEQYAVTDEASAMEWVGHPVQLVLGSCRNLKITVPEDLALAEFYLRRESAQRDSLL
ncbi:MAG: 2-C-methyl-D-erythritol 4-phosphate cytidylyltransferase [Cryomorphaceae bacterium]